jgi:hypothetical protein
MGGSLVGAGPVFWGVASAAAASEAAAAVAAEPRAPRRRVEMEAASLRPSLKPSFPQRSPAPEMDAVAGDRNPSPSVPRRHWRWRARALHLPMEGTGAATADGGCYECRPLLLHQLVHCATTMIGALTPDSGC